MIISCMVLQESSRRGSDGREYTSLLLLESGPDAMVQIWEYSLQGEELALRGKLQGKPVSVVVSGGGQVMGLFNGRIRVTGRLVVGDKVK